MEKSHGVKHYAPTEDNCVGQRGHMPVSETQVGCVRVLKELTNATARTLSFFLKVLVIESDSW